MEQNDIINLRVNDLAMGGEGVGRYNNIAVFVPNSIPGESVKVRISEIRKNYARGKVVDILTHSPERETTNCSLSGNCGGCQWQHINYKAQLRYKTNIIRETISRIGNLKNVKVKDIIGMHHPWGFRNKIQYPISKSKTHNQRHIVMGYYRQGTHDIVDIADCPIEHPKLSRTAKIVKDVLNRFGYEAYDEDARKGLFRHLLARIGFMTEEVILVLVTSDNAIPGSNGMIKELVHKLNNEDIKVVGICQNVNKRQTNVILGEGLKILWGRGYVNDMLGDIKLKISATSFYQTNPIQTKVLYNKALEYACISKNDTVIDAYSGIGTIALWFARHCAAVIGIEDNEQAVHDAAENAEINKIENCRFVIGKVEKELSYYKQASLLVMDPPRSGCDDKVLQQIIRSPIKKIVYISCNPATLARDLGYLSLNGYQVAEVQPVDMFPHSFHIESVTKLIRE